MDGREPWDLWTWDEPLGRVLSAAVAASGTSHTMLVRGLGWLGHISHDWAFRCGRRLADGCIASARSAQANDRVVRR